MTGYSFKVYSKINQTVKKKTCCVLTVFRNLNTSGVNSAVTQ